MSSEAKCFRCAGPHPTFACTASIIECIRAPEPTAPGIESTLAERDTRYGSFSSQAQITQQLKETLHYTEKWSLLPDDMKESLEMIASKIARILNGDPSYVDSWHDIAGYAVLIEKRLTP